MKRIVLLSGFLIALCFASFAQRISIIPQPLSLHEKSGNNKMLPTTRIVYQQGNIDLKAIGEQLSDQIKKTTGFQLKVTEAGAKPSKNEITLSLKNGIDSLGNEGYTLSVGSENIVVNGNKPAGVFYGTETIYQLLPVEKSNIKNATSVLVPAVDIVDKPRFPWRGLMLDVGRYFYSVDFIKKYIDELAMHKMNTFHWHLTEDHGWRIEIKKYPRLTEVGAWRNGTQFDRFKDHINHNPHGGYYTQDQIREVVKYAQERYVNIVPEMEMPGHTLAVLVAYPELSCTGGPFKIPLNWGIQKDIYCAGNEKTFEFIEDVLTEIADLFPSTVIHIGGDEAPKDRWKACPKCQKRIKDEHLKDEHELQSYFIKRIEDFLKTKNKKIIGWDEILEGGLAPNAMVMSWRGEEGGIAAAKQHHEVVMTPSRYTYLDYYQGEPYHEPAAIGGLLTLEKVYSYEPIPSVLTTKEATFIKGIQGNVWAEYIHSPEKAEYMAFPRAAAIAETGWSQPQNKDWESFKQRLEKQYKRYANGGINYSKSAYDVWIESSIDSSANKATVKLKTNSANHDIRYTIDGTEPTIKSAKYIDPFTFSLPATVKTASFRNGEKISRVSARSVFINKVD